MWVFTVKRLHICARTETFWAAKVHSVYTDSCCCIIPANYMMIINIRYTSKRSHLHVVHREMWCGYSPKAEDPYLHYLQYGLGACKTAESRRRSRSSYSGLHGAASKGCCWPRYHSALQHRSSSTKPGASWRSCGFTWVLLHSSWMSTSLRL